MQIKLFTIPIGDSGGALQEMNAFLRGNKILEVENHFVGNDNGAYWCFSVRYVERAYLEADKDAKKVDYRFVSCPFKAVLYCAQASRSDGIFVEKQRENRYAFRRNDI
jgi:hypothetical protein